MEIEETPRLSAPQRLKALLSGQALDRSLFMPITMTFAAKRYGVKYHDYVTDHRVLVETQIRIATEFGFDQVSCISDPAREAADLGAKVRFFEDQPPAIDEREALLGDKSKLKKLEIPDPMQGPRMRDRIEAARLFRERVGGKKIIEGWVEGPMAEASDLRGINTIMVDFYEDPSFVRDLFAYAVEMELAFAEAQVDAGAEIIGVGDAAASLVGPNFYREFIWPFEERLVDGIHAMGAGVRLHICGNTRKHLEGMGRLGCEIVDLDWMVPVAQARAAMRPDQVLLGNIDPVAVLKNGTPEGVLEGLNRCGKEAGRAYIVGAGCEVPPDTPEENIRAMREFAAMAPPHVFEP